MKLGVMANAFIDKSWEEACKIAKEAGLSAIEPGSGGFVGKTHCNPQELLKDKASIKKWVAVLQRGL
jgi:sugar phosphate isomerase/epimerase